MLAHLEQVVNTSLGQKPHLKIISFKYFVQLSESRENPK